MPITSKEINLKQLDEELGGKGLIADFNDPAKKSIFTAENSNVTEAELKSAIEAHVAVAYPEPSLDEKLASVGVSVDDLKVALGL
jgi:hypothetical protein